MTQKDTTATGIASNSDGASEAASAENMVRDYFKSIGEPLQWTDNIYPMIMSHEAFECSLPLFGKPVSLPLAGSAPKDYATLIIEVPHILHNTPTIESLGSVKVDVHGHACTLADTLMQTIQQKLASGRIKEGSPLDAKGLKTHTSYVMAGVSTLNIKDWGQAVEFRLDVKPEYANRLAGAVERALCAVQEIDSHISCADVEGASSRVGTVLGA